MSDILKLSWLGGRGQTFLDLSHMNEKYNEYEKTLIEQLKECLVEDKI